MKDKDRVWIAYTINVGQMHDADVNHYINEVAKALRPNDDSVYALFIPSRTEDNNVRLIYDPKGYRNKNNKENLKKAKKYLNKVLNEK